MYLYLVVRDRQSLFVAVYPTDYWSVAWSEDLYEIRKVHWADLKKL